MRIRAIHIEGFGKFADWSLEGLGKGITLLHGPNEAGKSTLLAFVRGVLFGFPTASQPGHIPSLSDRKLRTGHWRPLAGVAVQELLDLAERGGVEDGGEPREAGRRSKRGPRRQQSGARGHQRHLADDVEGARTVDRDRARDLLGGAGGDLDVELLEQRAPVDALDPGARDDPDRSDGASLVWVPSSGGRLRRRPFCRDSRSGPGRSRPPRTRPSTTQ